MNIVVACIVLYMAVTQALPEQMGRREKDYWPSQDQHQADPEEPTYDRYLMRIVKNLNKDTFYGSMGKRNSDSVRMSPKRQKIDSFIGLMGKRSLHPESEERSTDNDNSRRRE
ncbi:protachykinin-1-like [Eleutherodactylus coqui]|uniref:protachykinin-1-like n=1 Tax=Eleutherodactylus coqui TaxID=57060 RepID=UPI0034626E33